MAAVPVPGGIDGGLRTGPGRPGRRRDASPDPGEAVGAGGPALPRPRRPGAQRAVPRGGGAVRAVPGLRAGAVRRLPRPLAGAVRPRPPGGGSGLPGRRRHRTPHLPAAGGHRGRRLRRRALAARAPPRPRRRPPRRLRAGGRADRRLLAGHLRADVTCPARAGGGHPGRPTDPLPRRSRDLVQRDGRGARRVGPGRRLGRAPDPPGARARRRAGRRRAAHAGPGGGRLTLPGAALPLAGLGAAGPGGHGDPARSHRRSGPGGGRRPLRPGQPDRHRGGPRGDRRGHRPAGARLHRRAGWPPRPRRPAGGPRHRPQAPARRLPAARRRPPGRHRPVGGLPAAHRRAHLRRPQASPSTRRRGSAVVGAGADRPPALRRRVSALRGAAPAAGLGEGQRGGGVEGGGRPAALPRRAAGASRAGLVGLPAGAGGTPGPGAQPPPRGRGPV